MESIQGQKQRCKEGDNDRERGRERDWQPASQNVTENKSER